MVYPAYGVIFAKGLNGFSHLDPHMRRYAGDRSASWLFILAIFSACSIGVQNYMFSSAAATLTFKIRSLSFRAILRQDSECYAFQIYHQIVQFLPSL
jgi:ATP-binding cassette subfamily B (MDR/TAP) protein 1